MSGSCLKKHQQLRPLGDLRQSNLTDSVDLRFSLHDASALRQTLHAAPLLRWSDMPRSALGISRSEDVGINRYYNESNGGQIYLSLP